MGIISQEKARNYLPLDVKTRLSCRQRRANSGWSVKKADGYEPYRSNPKKKHNGKYHTPEHNGKVERSHRIDQEKFYRTLRFYSLDDLRKQGKAWMDRYNSTPRMVLNLKSPNQAELDSLRRIMESTGEVKCPRLLKCLTSIENLQINTYLA